MLTVNRLKEVIFYNPKTGQFKWKRRKYVRQIDHVGNINRGYLRIKINNKLYLAHRLAWLYMTGNWPNSELDHINGDKSDNRFNNLRQTDHKTNSENRRKSNKNNTNKLLGVSYRPNCIYRSWESRIRVNGKIIYLGYFSNAEEAHQAYLDAKRKYHGGCTI